MKLYPLMKNYEKYGLSAELNDPSGMPDIQQVGIMVGIRNKQTGAWETNHTGDASVVETTYGWEPVDHPTKQGIDLAEQRLSAYHE